MPQLCRVTIRTLINDDTSRIWSGLGLLAEDLFVSLFVKLDEIFQFLNYPLHYLWHELNLIRLMSFCRELICKLISKTRKDFSICYIVTFIIDTRTLVAWVLELVIETPLKSSVRVLVLIAVPNRVRIALELCMRN